MSNLARGADLPPEDIKEQKKLPTGDQLIQLINALEGPISTLAYLASMTSPLLHDVVIVLLDSALRLGEALALQWSDVHLIPT